MSRNSPSAIINNAVNDCIKQSSISRDDLIELLIKKTHRNYQTQCCWQLYHKCRHPGERRTAGNGRDATENTRKLEAVFRSGIFRIFSVDSKNSWLSGRIRPEIIRKNPGNSRREYCFHVPDISRVSLQDPVTFPHISCKIRWQERSLWARMKAGQLSYNI
jgi:hypothetical protein